MPRPITPALVALLLGLAACTATEGPLSGVTSTTGGGALLLDGKPAPLATTPIVTQAETRRSSFRLSQEAALGNIDRAQPLQRRLTAVNVLAAEADLATVEDIEPQRQRRNFYVGALLTASDERCEAWFEVLGETDRETNFVFGTISTITGALGGIFTPAATARALAGAAGISSGIRAEFNGTFFAQQTANAIIDAIKKERATQRTAILGSFGQSNADWPLARARVEVQAYHDTCSLPGGVRLIQDALRRPAAVTQEAALRRQTYINAATQFASRCTQVNAVNQAAAIKAQCDELKKVMTEFRPAREEESPVPPVAPPAAAPRTGGSSPGAATTATTSTTTQPQASP